MKAASLCGEAAFIDPQPLHPPLTSVVIIRIRTGPVIDIGPPIVKAAGD
jgi:hypothetical protein